MRRAIGAVAFWTLQLVIGGLFAVAFIFAVPQSVDSWFLRAVSVALGGLYGLGVLAGFGFALWVAMFGEPAEPSVCPRCGQPLPSQTPGAEPGAAADPRRPSGSGGV